MIRKMNNNPGIMLNYDTKHKKEDEKLLIIMKVVRKYMKEGLTGHLELHFNKGKYCDHKVNGSMTNI